LACADAEHCLAAHFDSVVQILAGKARPVPTDEKTYRALLRIARRAGAELPVS
jgi:hypothetical protein